MAIHHKLFVYCILTGLMHMDFQKRKGLYYYYIAIVYAHARLNALRQNRYEEVILTNENGSRCFIEARRDGCFDFPQTGLVLLSDC